MNTQGTSLPPVFAHLREFADVWCLEDTRARSAARCSASMEALRDFYEAMSPVIGQALIHLSDLKLGALDEANENLMRLCLGYAEIAPAVEWFETPLVCEDMEVDRLQMTRVIADTKAQDRS